MTLAPLAGSPDVVRRVGQDYERTAADIRAAVAELRRIASPDAMVSVSLEKVRGDASKVAGEILQAEARYAQTGDALIGYAHELQDAQDEARAAIADYEVADADASTQARAHDSAEQTQLKLANDATTTPEQLVASARSIARLDQAADAALADRAAALRRYQDAVEARDQAATRAADRIHDIIDSSDLNDSFWDNLTSFLGDVVEFVASVVRAVVDAIVAVATAIVLAVIAVVVLIAAVIVLGLALVVLLVAAAIAIAVIAVVVALAVVLAFIAVALVASLLVLAVVILVGLIGLVLLQLAVMLPIAAAFTLAGLLMGKDPYDALVGGIIASLIITTPALLAVIAAAAMAERGEPTLVEHEDVRKIDPNQSFQSLFTELYDIDKAGHDPSQPDSENENSVVQITTFSGSNGEPIYRITMPSTQQWTPGGTSGNDVTSDLVGKMDPFQRTQLEKMVMDAMREQGIPPGSHVMLAGWSLGGITAGNLAADPEFSQTYQIDAVVAAGSSLDDIPIPAHTKVLDVEHTTDPVPHTENPFLPDHRDDGNRYKITEPTPPGQSAPFGHDVQRYRDTVGTSVDGATAGPGYDFRTATGSDGVNISDYFGEPIDADRYVYERG